MDRDRLPIFGRIPFSRLLHHHSYSTKIRRIDFSDFLSRLFFDISRHLNILFPLQILHILFCIACFSHQIRTIEVCCYARIERNTVYFFSYFVYRKFIRCKMIFLYNSRQISECIWIRSQIALYPIIFNQDDIGQSFCIPTC